ncbi:DUF1146 family protein [Ureibacillus composti]|nr:DUF1146 family protein [Ureibacillus composti]
MEVYQTFGMQAILGMASHLFFIAITFYALQAIRIEQIFKKGNTFRIQLIYILLSIAIGASVSNFFLDFTVWSGQLPYLFS